ncbi:hypothetical protein CBS115989_10627 [Aspergillus niger]|nr:hypothetical protein CBS115989_10627 [Aspergillus niger]KAI2835122.1 hypothetical protein CBS11232_10613 [Aspergillus niger]KAI2868524.1 hypothetical protein CBS115988_10652 [Aspergillus niger]KAI2898204.1 hypothetical protein CBS13152_2983 [Aspergillus niger]GKZ95122.1 hypothetical protein AnigIFM59636_008861 [Aspergillus niger]
MASASDASIQEILEDIELNQVILQSLDEERPDAAEDRQEILDVIKRLEARLAVLQGRSTGGPSAASPPPGPVHSGLSSAQLDGAFSDAPQNAGSTPSVDSSSSSDDRSVLRFDVAHEPSTLRKRLHFSSEDSHPEDDEDDSDSSDFTDDLEAPNPRRPKRMRRVSPEAEPSNDASDDDLGDPLAGNEQLRQILGIDSADIMREIQEEQRRAEKWLEERREQERRDAEFARRLNDSFYEPSESPSSSQSIFPLRPSVSASGPAFASNRPSMTDTDRFPESRARSKPSDSLHSHRSPVNGTQDSQPLLGSDDSDLAEITPSDFQRHCHISAAPHERPPRWGSSAPTMPNRPGLQPQQSRGLYASPGPPAGIGSGSVFGPHVMSNTMARLNAGREMLEQAGRMIFGGNDSRSSNIPYIDLEDYQGPGGFGKARDYLE